MRSLPSCHQIASPAAWIGRDCRAHGRNGSIGGSQSFSVLGLFDPRDQANRAYREDPTLVSRLAASRKCYHQSNPGRTKNGREHLLPLPGLAWRIVEQIPRRESNNHLFGDGVRGFGNWDTD